MAKQAPIDVASGLANVGKSAPLSGHLTKIAEAKFLEAFSDILVREPVDFVFAGSVGENQMQMFWVWLTRDLLPILPSAFAGVAPDSPTANEIIDRNAAKIVTSVNEALAQSSNSQDARRRFLVQVGGDEIAARVPTIAAAIKNRMLFDKARSFGVAANSLPDSDSLAEALNSLPLKEQQLTAFMLHIIVGQANSPHRLTGAVVGRGKNASEASIKNAGFAPLLDGLFAHAQSMVSIVTSERGIFGDVDLVCSSVERFHKLMRAVTGYVELVRGSHWSEIANELARRMSAEIEPGLRDVMTNVTLAMRRPRDHSDNLDPEQYLVALKSIYLLRAVRDARDSLAVNALFDKVWAETGQILEMQLERYLELFADNPSDEALDRRIDMGLKLAELRFGGTYAQSMRKARDNTARRLTDTG